MMRSVLSEPSCPPMTALTVEHMPDRVQEDTRRELACGRECLLTFRLMPHGLAREVTGEAVRPVVLHAQAPALAHGSRPRGPFPARAPVHERALAPGAGGVRPGRCRPGEAAVRGA